MAVNPADDRSQRRQPLTHDGIVLKAEEPSGVAAWSVAKIVHEPDCGKGRERGRHGNPDRGGRAHRMREPAPTTAIPSSTTTIGPSRTAENFVNCAATNNRTNADAFIGVGLRHSRHSE